MNGMIAQLVPQVVVEVVVVTDTAAEVEKRQTKMIQASADVQEALLDEMTPKGLNYIQTLIIEIGLDLAYCRQHLEVEVLTGT